MRRDTLAGGSVFYCAADLVGTQVYFTVATERLGESLIKLGTVTGTHYVPGEETCVLVQHETADDGPRVYRRRFSSVTPRYGRIASVFEQLAAIEEG